MRSFTKKTRNWKTDLLEQLQQKEVALEATQRMDKSLEQEVEEKAAWEEEKASWESELLQLKEDNLGKGGHGDQSRRASAPASNSRKRNGGAYGERSRKDRAVGTAQERKQPVHPWLN